MVSASMAWRGLRCRRYARPSTWHAGHGATARHYSSIAPGVEILEVADGGHFVQEHGAKIATAACDAFGI
jgi:hypothetical protein